MNVQIPISLIRDQRLSRAARLLYPLLKSYADYDAKDDYFLGAHPGMRRLCRELNCSRSTLVTALDELRAATLVTWGRRRTNHYRLRALPGHFVQTPVSILRGPLPIGPKMTYCVIHTFDVWGTTGEGAYPRRGQLRDILGCSYGGLHKWLAALTRAQLLEVRADGEYMLGEVPRYEWDSDGLLEAVDTWVPMSDTGSTDGVAQGVPLNRAQETVTDSVAQGVPQSDTGSTDGVAQGVPQSDTGSTIPLVPPRITLPRINYPDVDSIESTSEKVVQSDSQAQTSRPRIRISPLVDSSSQLRTPITAGPPPWEDSYEGLGDARELDTYVKPVHDLHGVGRVLPVLRAWRAEHPQEPLYRFAVACDLAPAALIKVARARIELDAPGKG